LYGLYCGKIGNYTLICSIYIRLFLRLFRSSWLLFYKLYMFDIIESKYTKKSGDKILFEHHFSFLMFKNINIYFPDFLCVYTLLYFLIPAVWHVVFLPFINGYFLLSDNCR